MNNKEAVIGLNGKVTEYDVKQRDSFYASEHGVAGAAKEEKLKKKNIVIVDNRRNPPRRAQRPQDPWAGRDAGPAYNKPPVSHKKHDGPYYQISEEEAQAIKEIAENIAYTGNPRFVETAILYAYTEFNNGTMDEVLDLLCLTEDDLANTILSLFDNHPAKIAFFRALKESGAKQDIVGMCTEALECIGDEGGSGRIRLHRLVRDKMQEVKQGDSKAQEMQEDSKLENHTKTGTAGYKKIREDKEDNVPEDDEPFVPRNLSGPDLLDDLFGN